MAKPYLLKQLKRVFKKSGKIRQIVRYFFDYYLLTKISRKQKVIEQLKRHYVLSFQPPEQLIENTLSTTRTVEVILNGRFFFSHDVMSRNLLQNADEFNIACFLLHYVWFSEGQFMVAG
jgi:hypothetical protein